MLSISLRFHFLRASVWSKNNGGGGGIRQCIKVSVSGFTDFVWTEGRFVYKKKRRQFLKVSGLVWTGPELRRNNYSGLDNEIRLRVGTGQPCSVILKQWNSCRISFIDFYFTNFSVLINNFTKAQGSWLYPIQNNVILLESYGGTITEPGVVLEPAASSAGLKRPILPLFPYFSCRF